MRTRGTIYRAVLWTMLATTMLAACTSWKVQTVSPEQLIAAEHPSAVRVQRQDGSRVVVNSPRIATDSLLGMTDRRSPVTADRSPVSVPLADISQVAVRHISVGSTVVGLFGLGLVATAGAFLYIVLASNASGS